VADALPALSAWVEGAADVAAPAPSAPDIPATPAPSAPDIPATPAPSAPDARAASSPSAPDARAVALALRPLVRQALLLARHYDCVVTNPPYMGARGMNATLKTFARAHHPYAGADLFALFMERGFTLARPGGYTAMITMHSWMFLSSFQRLRASILTRRMLITMAHLGTRAFGAISGEVVQTTAFVCRNLRLEAWRPTFFRLLEGGEPDKRRALAARSGRFDRLSQADFHAVPGSPLAYWISPAVRDSFLRTASPRRGAALEPDSDPDMTPPPLRHDGAAPTTLASIALPHQGLATGDNDRFLRCWWEVAWGRIGLGLESRHAAARSGKRWFPYHKGGPHRRWYGNLELVVDWADDGRAIRHHRDASGRLRSRPQNTAFYFREGITWSDITTRAFAARYAPPGALFDVKGSAGFPEPRYRMPVLGLLCSRLARLYMDILNPTVTLQVGDIGRIPFLPDEALLDRVRPVVEEAVSIARADWDSLETSWDFRTSPLLEPDVYDTTLERSLQRLEARSAARIRRMRALETENNRLFIEAYGLTGELDPEVAEEEVTLDRFDRATEVRRLLSYAVGCMMGRYRLDRQGLEGPRDAAWRSPDGIVPLDDDPGNVVDRLVAFLHAVWGAAPLEANLRTVADALEPRHGGTGETGAQAPLETIRRYFAAAFYPDHLRRYRRRPIYWRISSGRLRAFECLLYVHRYHEGTLERLYRTYVVPRQARLEARLAALEARLAAFEARLAALEAHAPRRLETGVSDAPASIRLKLRRQMDILTRQRDELVRFGATLRRLAEQRIPLDLDDGVRANYRRLEPLLTDVNAVIGSPPANDAVIGSPPANDAVIGSPPANDAVIGSPPANDADAAPLSGSKRRDR
jgi:hypothetical protein